MKILFFSRLFYPHIGGVEKHILEVSKLLIKKGHKITLVTEQHSKELKLHEVVEGIEVFRIPNLRDGKAKKFEIWKWLFKNPGLIGNADIVHCHDVFFWYLPFKFLYLNKPVFTTFHGYESYPLNSKLISMHKISEKLSNGNICIGDFMKKWYGTKPDYISYGGVNVVKSEKLRVKSSEGAVFMGRLDEQTGILDYVKGVKLIRKKIKNFEFEIIGDGKFRNKIEKDFKVLGFQKNPEKYFLKYNFAFVSRYLSILEAMAAKRLIFASYDNPIKEDYLKMAPFSKNIVIFNSPAELAQGVLFYLDNPRKKEEMVDCAYNWAKNQTWEQMTNIYLRLWNR